MYCWRWLCDSEYLWIRPTTINGGLEELESSRDRCSYVRILGCGCNIVGEPVPTQTNQRLCCQVQRTLYQDLQAVQHGPNCLGGASRCQQVTPLCASDSFFDRDCCSFNCCYQCRFWRILVVVVVDLLSLSSFYADSLQFVFLRLEGWGWGSASTPYGTSTAMQILVLNVPCILLLALVLQLPFLATGYDLI